jgi:hypothetical protein
MADPRHTHDAPVETRKLEPHAPLPDGRHVSVLRRFDEDNPDQIVTEIVLGTAPGRTETANPKREDGTPMPLGEAIQAARQVAASEGIAQVFVIDRLAGAREHEVLEHHGDHSADMEKLDDMDLEEGERGPDMRDRIR